MALEDFPTGHHYEEISNDDKENVHGAIASVESDNEQETLPTTNSMDIPMQTSFPDVFSLSMNSTSEPDIANLALGSNTTPRTQQMTADRDTRTGMQTLLNDGAEPEGERGHSLSPAELAQIARLGEAVRRRRDERGRRNERGRYGRNFLTRSGQRRGSIFLESRRISRTYGRGSRRRLPYY